MISLCMIAGDANGLERCLSMVALAVDEIVLVDCSRGGDVRKIARHVGASYLRYTFSDFAVARQAAVQIAQGDWLLVLDPDEELDPHDLQMLLAKVDIVDAWAFRVPRYDYIGSKGWALSRPCRFFRRSPAVQYVGAVYEEPVFLDRFGVEPETAWDVMIHHSGFCHPDRDDAKKRLLYRTLLERGPAPADCPRIWHNRALLLADSGDWNRSLSCARTALALANGREAASASLLLARLLAVVGKVDCGLKILRDAEHDWPFDSYQWSRLANLRGLLMLSLEQWQEACAAFSAAIECGYPVATYEFNLAQAERRLGNAPRANSLLGRAKQLNPRIESPRKCPITYQDQWVHQLDTAQQIF
jgi:tetratricopeptide (TPR) repeat protein